MRHENSDSKQLYRSKVTSAIDINGNAYSTRKFAAVAHKK